MHEFNKVAVNLDATAPEVFNNDFNYKADLNMVMAHCPEMCTRAVVCSAQLPGVD